MPDGSSVLIQDFDPHAFIGMIEFSQQSGRAMEQMVLTQLFLWENHCHSSSFQVFLILFLPILMLDPPASLGL